MKGSSEGVGAFGSDVEAEELPKEKPEKAGAAALWAGAASEAFVALPKEKAGFCASVLELAGAGTPKLKAGLGAGAGWVSATADIVVLGEALLELGLAVEAGENEKAGAAEVSKEKAAGSFGTLA